MAGILVPVIRHTAYRAPAITTGDSTILIAQLIDTLGWRSGVLLVRVHANAFTGSGGTVVVGAVNQMVSSDDPSTIFDDDTPLALATIIPTTPAGRLITVPFAPAALGQSFATISRYVGINLGFTPSGNNTIGGYVTISVDLLGRDT